MVDVDNPAKEISQHHGYDCRQTRIIKKIS